MKKIESMGSIIGRVADSLYSENGALDGWHGGHSSVT